MFKKGQLVRSTRTGWLYVVCYDHHNLEDFINVRCVSRKTTRHMLCVPGEEMELIGNNYRAKPKWLKKLR